MVSRNALVAVLLSIAVVPMTSFAVDPSGIRSVADTTPRTGPKGDPTTRPKKPANTVDALAEAAASNLVRNHLPELRGVLQRLRSDDPKQYKRAVADLARSAKKLEFAKNRDERLFEIEVENLQAQNSVNLLTAKLKVRDNDSDRHQLRRSLSRLQRAQLTRARYDVDVLQTRLQKTKQQLQNAEQKLATKRENSDADLEKSYTLFLRKAGRQNESSQRTTNASKTKPASARKPASSKNDPN